MPGNKPPWTVPTDHSDSDKTARLRIVEIQQHVSDLAIQKLNDKVEALDNKFDTATKEITESIAEVTIAIRDLRSENLSKELQTLEKKHQKELQETKEKSETSAKVKLMWTGLGALFSALIAIIISIFKTRFGG